MIKVVIYLIHSITACNKKIATNRNIISQHIFEITFTPMHEALVLATQGPAEHCVHKINLKIQPLD